MKSKWKLGLNALWLVLAMLCCLPAYAQDIQATGTVTDSNDEPLIGVTIMVKGHAGMGTTTDVDGNFSISVPAGSTLRFSYIGYMTMEKKAEAKMKIVMTEDNQSLDEVVVIGYGKVKRKDLTTAVSTVDEQALENRPIVSAAQAL